MSAIDGWLQRIAATISKNLVNPLTDSIGNKVEGKIEELTPGLAKVVAEEAIPPIVDAVIAEFEKQTPQLVEAVVRAVATSMSDLFVRTEDRTTDMIPGPLDDMIDPVVRDIMSKLFGTNEPGGTS